MIFGWSHYAKQPLYLIGVGIVLNLTTMSGDSSERSSLIDL